MTQSVAVRGGSQLQSGSACVCCLLTVMLAFVLSCTTGRTGQSTAGGGGDVGGDGDIESSTGPDLAEPADKDIAEPVEDVPSADIPTEDISPEEVASPGDIGSGDTATEEDTPPEDTPPEDTTPPGIEVPGCDGAFAMMPQGYSGIRVDPENVTLVVPYDQMATQSFEVILTAVDGSEEVKQGATFLMDASELGEISAGGDFESLPARGGTAKIQAMIMGIGCIETGITVITEYHGVVGETSPEVPDWFTAALPAVGGAAPEYSCEGICNEWQEGWPCQCIESCGLVPGGCCEDYVAQCEGGAVDPAGPELLYPLDKAAWPANLPPMVAQWTLPAAGKSAVFRIAFEAPYARIYVYGNALKWQAQGQPDAFVAEMSVEAWAKLWELRGGWPHVVSVASAEADESGFVSPVVQSAGHTVTFTEDLFGGAVYYWNIEKQGIRILNFSPDSELLSSVEIEGGCHGCHAASPDGSTIAVTFNVGTTPDSCGTVKQGDFGTCTDVLGWGYGQPAGLQGQCTEITGCECGDKCDALYPTQAECMQSCSHKNWTMELHDIDTGLESDWVEETARWFLNDTGVMYSAFSNAYWTETKKHVVVTKAETPTAPRSLYSVDLLSGDIWDMTGDFSQLGGAQLFPAFARNGEFVVFTDTASAGKSGIGANGNSQLWRTDYNTGLGGTPTPLPGADDPALLQYYPAITPDDQYVIFNRASGKAECPESSATKGGPSGTSTYDHCFAELWLVGADGGTPVRLDLANGPPESPYHNSWPSMSDQVVGKRYWIAFSSRRSYGVLGGLQPEVAGGGPIPIDPNNPPGKPPIPPKPSNTLIAPQLWVTSVDPSLIGTGEDPSSAPIWIPGQDTVGGNHIGQWAVR